MTRPDNACADVVTQFDVTDRDGIPAWTPVFAEQADACDDPLLSWLYVVTIDRAALGDRADFVIPASELYDVPPTILEYRGVEQPDGEAATVTLTPTDVVVPLPPESEPELHNTAAGMFYVVNHGDGDVSVVPATIDLISPVDPDTTNLMSFVVASESGRSFFSEGEVWDAWGRSTAPERVDDLTGYAGRIVGDEVEILASDATRVEGDPEVPDEEQYPLPGRPFDDGITVEQFFTLSSSGPIWRMFDAQLVVEEGVGRICPVDQVVEPMGCPDTGMVIDTQVRSSNTDLTSWYGSPILAFQDPFRGFTHVVPLAGSSSSNDTVGTDLATDGSVVTSVKIACGGPGGELLVASVGLDLPPGQSRTLTIVDGDQEYGQSVASGSGEMSISFGLLASPPDSAELVVSDGDTEQARIPIPPERPDCPERSDAVQ
ncbi:MAG: hypothetical protein KDB37_18400, partial [Ilumatobacter sp.]|nr:hypothetical protein [Ilumatobacter sp.]